MNVQEIFRHNEAGKLELPLFGMSVSAGLPTAADDDVETKLDLNEYMIKYPASTFFVRVHGEDMVENGIYSGDLLVVDESVEPKDGK